MTEGDYHEFQLKNPEHKMLWFLYIILHDFLWCLSSYCICCVCTVGIFQHKLIQEVYSVIF